MLLVGLRTVSQICSLICLPSMLIMRAPNSTPIVKSCTGWKRLSVNCSSRQDFPTPAINQSTKHEPLQAVALHAHDYGSLCHKVQKASGAARACVPDDDVFEQIPALPADNASQI